MQILNGDSNPTEVHGHEVMQMMVDSGRSYDAESLEQAIIEKFGAQTRFHTCSANGMTAKELVVFLANKNKFVSGDGGFTTTPDNICNH